MEFHPNMWSVMSDNLFDEFNGSTNEVSTVESPGSTGAADSEPETAVDDLGTQDSSALSLDATFDILRNRRRQLVLEFIRDRDEKVTIGELAERIAAIENDTTVRQLNAQQRKRVYIGLYQSHLPKMADVDVIEFNQSRGHVSRGENIEPLFKYLDVATGRVEDDDDEPEPHPFAGRTGGVLAVIGLTFFVAQFSGAYLVATACVFLLLTGAVLATR